MADGESTTDAHPTKRHGKAREVAGQAAIPTALATLILGVAGGFVRNRDVERIESRQDKTEEGFRQLSGSVIELKADSRNQGEKLDRLVQGVDTLNVKIDSIRDRLPR